MKNFTEFLSSHNNKDIKSEVVIFGAGTIGRLTFGALKKNKIATNFFCDSDVRKQKSKIEGIEVISPETLYNFDKENTDIFISANYFKSILPNLTKQGFKNIYVATELLESSDIHDLYKKMDRKFFVGELFPLKLERTVAFYNEMGRKEEYVKDGKLKIKTIDVQITEKCSLKCKDCSNLMQYYTRPKDSELNTLMQSVDKFMNCVDSLDEFRILGGDPFMSKDLYKIINKLVTYDNCKKVVVYTNARIVPKGDNLEALRNNKVILDITNYGESSSAHLKVIELAKKENIAYSTMRCTTWQDCGRIIPFSNKNLNDLEHQFANCCNSDLITLLHGKLYRCPFSANGVNLDAIPQKSSDEVNLLDENLSINQTREQIKKLCYEKKYLEACYYCNGRDYSSVDIDSAVQTKKPLDYSKVVNSTFKK